MKYIFSEKQLIALLALSDIKSVCLFEQEHTLKESELIPIVAELYMDGRLTEEDGRLMPIADLRKMFGQMEQAGYVTQLSFGTGSFPNVLVYPADKGALILLEREEAGGDCLKLQRIQAEEYLTDLFENEQLPDDLTEDRAEAESLERDAAVDHPEEWQEADVLLRINRVYGNGGQMDNEIEVIQSPIYKWIRGWGGYEEFFHIFSKEELGDLLLKEMRGMEL